MTKEQLLRHIDDRAIALGSSRALARECGVSAQYLHDVQVGTRSPGQKLLDGLGIEMVVTYRRKKDA